MSNMPITFDTTNKWILLPDLSPTYTITAQEIYNSAMDFCDNPEAMDDDPPMRATGYAALGGGVYSDKIFILQKGWKLKPYPGNYTLTVIGTLIALDDNGNPYERTVPPDYGTVHFVFQVSSQGIVTETVSNYNAIADAVWTKKTDELTEKGTIGKMLVNDDKLIKSL